MCSNFFNFQHFFDFSTDSSSSRWEDSESVEFVWKNFREHILIFDQSWKSAQKWGFSYYGGFLFFGVYCAIAAKTPRFWGPPERCSEPLSTRSNISRKKVTAPFVTDFFDRLFNFDENKKNSRKVKHKNSTDSNSSRPELFRTVEKSKNYW